MKSPSTSLSHPSVHRALFFLIDISSLSLPFHFSVALVLDERYSVAHESVCPKPSPPSPPPQTRPPQSPLRQASLFFRAIVMEFLVVNPLPLSSNAALTNLLSSRRFFFCLRSVYLPLSPILNLSFLLEF